MAWRWAWVMAIVLGMGGAIIQPAEAQQPLHLILEAQPSGNFRSLMQQAEMAAQGLVQQAFATPTESTVSVMVLADYNGQVAPLLMVTVSRDQWQQDPALNQWTRYFRDAAVLLGYSPQQRSQPIAPSQPAPVPLAYSPMPSWLTDIEPNFYQ